MDEIQPIGRRNNGLERIEIKALILVVAGGEKHENYRFYSIIHFCRSIEPRVVILLRGKAAAWCAFTADHLGEQRSLHFSHEWTSPDCPR